MVMVVMVVMVLIVVVLIVSNSSGIGNVDPECVNQRQTIRTKTNKNKNKKPTYSNSQMAVWCGAPMDARAHVSLGWWCYNTHVGDVVVLMTSPSGHIHHHGDQFLPPRISQALVSPKSTHTGWFQLLFSLIICITI